MGEGAVEDAAEAGDVPEVEDAERAPPTITLPQHQHMRYHTRQHHMGQFLPHLANLWPRHHVQQRTPTSQSTSITGTCAAHVSGTSLPGTPANHAHTRHRTLSTTTGSLELTPSSTSWLDGTFQRRENTKLHCRQLHIPIKHDR